MNVYQKFALDHFFSSYPVEDTFEEIIEKILDYDDDVIVWEGFINEDACDVAQSVEQMVRDLERLFVPKEVV